MMQPSGKNRLTSWELIFEPIRSLGEPDPSNVMLVRDRSSGDLAALKLVPLESIDLIRRELLAIETLDHPGIVQLFGHDLDTAQPWIATSYVEGGSLDRHWGTRDRAGWRERVETVRRLIPAIAYIHGAGVVHRDLKPSNIAIGDAGRPILLDFGMAGWFASRDGRDRIDIGGFAQGTLDYMAPEQLQGDYVDARSDLYALGCLLFRAAAGHPPYGGSPAEVVDGHLYHAPPDLSAIVEGCPPLLADIVRRLLSKDRRDRPGFASDVASSIDAALDAAALDVPVPSYLYRPAFVGREDVVGKLDARIRTAIDRAGGISMLEGESGSGKTRLAMEATRLATGRGVRVLTGECQPVDTRRGASARGAAFHPIRTLLRSLGADCQTEGPVYSDRVLGSRVWTLQRFEPSLRELARGDDPTVPLSPDAARGRAIADMRESLVAYAHEQPFVLVLDDLQWADDMTVELLDSLRHNPLSDAPVLIIGTYRTDEASETVRRLASPDDIYRVGRLNDAEVQTLVCEMLATRDAPEDLSALLSRVAGGNPFFVAEYLRSAVESGALARDSEGRWSRTEKPIAAAEGTPVSLRNLVRRRVSALGPVSTRFLNAGAVLGRRFSPAHAGEAAKVDGGARRAAIAELVRRDVCEHDEAGDLRFFHDKIREVVYDDLGDSDRHSLHHASAGILVDQYRSSVEFERHYGDIARHWKGAGALPEAQTFSGLAGEVALRDGSHSLARDFFETALEIDERLEPNAGNLQRARWLRMAATAAFGVSDLEDSINYASSAILALDETVPNTPARAALLASREILKQVAGWPRLRDRVTRDLDRRESILEVGRAADQLATCHYYDANMGAVMANVFRALNRKESVGAGEVPDMLSRVGFVVGSLGLGRAAERFFERSRSLGRSTDQRWALGNALYIEGQYRLGQTEWDRTEDLARSASTLLREIGDIHEAEIADVIGTHGQCYRGAFEESEVRALRLQESAEGRGHDQHIAWGRAFVARSRLRKAQVGGVSEELAESVERVDGLPDVVSIVICRGLWAQALLLERELDRAVEVARSVLTLLSSGRRPLVGQCIDGYWGMADVLVTAAECRPGVAGSVEEATRGCRELARFARVFPVARVPAAICSARLRSLNGRRRDGIRRLSWAVEEAEKRSMPFDAAMASFHLARLSHSSAEDAVISDARSMEWEALGAHAMPEVLLSLYANGGER